MSSSIINQPVADSQASNFPCRQCGALLTFKPGTDLLTCRYCGTENAIEAELGDIKEYDFRQALAELAQAKPSVEVAQIQCQACGAGFRFAANLHAGECPFCGTEVVTSTEVARPITPKSLLPFKVNKAQAQQQFRKWLKGLLFAPNKVKKYAGDDAKLTGVYLPYWTFDSDTETEYTGARGDVYYVTEQVQTLRGGQWVNQTRQVAKIRWTPVRGRVERFFDDVLVGASLSLPRQILDQLEPWDLTNLVPYDESYLSGFGSEYYQVNLNQGFDAAKAKMESMIYHDIAFDIGGDQQQIHQFRTHHDRTTYKHCLLPVWSAAFRFKHRTYRFIINGRTGQVQGERPYSYWKIGFAILLGLIAASVFFLMLQRGGSVSQTRQAYYPLEPSFMMDSKTK